MKRRLQVVLSVLQGLVVTALGALEFLSYKKAGVSHHLRFKRTYYLHHLLTPGVRLALGAVMAVFVLYVVYSVAKKGRKSLLPIGIWSFILMVLFLLSTARELMAYPYMVLGGFVNLVLSGLALSRR
nr:hypothetical protein [uncultured Peptoniphilus sp.]